MDWRSMLRRLVLYVDVKDEELKGAILLSLCLVLGFFLLSEAVSLLRLVVLAKTLLVAAFAYELLLVDFCKDYIDKRFNNIRFERVLDFLKDVLFSLIIFFSFIVTVIVIITPATVEPTKLFSLIAGLIIFLIPYVLWKQLLAWFNVKVASRIFVIILFFSLFSIASAQNDTLSQTFSTIQRSLDAFSQIWYYINRFLQIAGSVKSFFSNFGLDDIQSNAVIIVVALIGFYMVLRMLKWIVKWAILIMIVWVALQVLGII